MGPQNPILIIKAPILGFRVFLSIINPVGHSSLSEMHLLLVTGVFSTVVSHVSTQCGNAFFFYFLGTSCEEDATIDPTVLPRMTWGLELVGSH